MNYWPRFLPYRGSKTGLGSSAALVSSLTGVVQVMLADAAGKYISMDGPVAQSPGKTLTFVVAQLAHAVAQHSIGSGFDIASAVVGSCRYVRFSTARLAGVTDGELSNEAFRALILDTWDHDVQEFSLPPRCPYARCCYPSRSLTHHPRRIVTNYCFFFVFSF